MRLIPLLLAPLALAVAGCGASLQTGAAIADGVGASPPVTVADRTVLDEKAAIAAETAYRLSARAAALAIKAGIVSGPSVARIGELDRQAYAALTALRAAYRAGNATGYVEAFAQFNRAVLAVNSMLGSN